MSEFLVWPDTPSHKGMRRIERQPSATTSGKYQEMFETNHLAKAAEEGKKARTEKEAEEANQEKKNKVPKRTAKIKLFKEVNDNIGWNSVCHICKRRMKHGCQLRCDYCQNLYHELCVPNYHKKRIPVSEDGNTFSLSQLLQRRKYKQRKRNDTVWRK
jgi:hypothetical protein